MAYCLGRPDGTLLARHRRPTEPSGDPDQDIARMGADARALLDEAGLAPGDLAGVGVAVPGPLDPARDRVIDPPNMPGWHDVNVVARLRDALPGVPMVLENDANAAALAEARFGAGKGFRSLVYLTMSTGVGGGIVMDGKVRHGRTVSAGEVGHIPLVWEGESCFCGLRGCAEAYLGGRAWARRLAGVAPPDGRVAELAGGREHATPVQVVEAAKEGDAFALAEIERFNRYLAQTLVVLTFVLDPDAIVLGTIVAAAGDELVLDPVRSLVREHAWGRIAEGLELRAASLGEELPYYAGLCVALAASDSSSTS